MAAKLKVVCTPIGNLADLAPRAKEALLRAPVILAEDTRHTRRLLSAMQISLTDKKLISCDQRRETERVSVIIEHLQQGDDVVLVSDAGAPCVSDPGARLVDAVTQAGISVEVVPGPSAVIAALMGAGLDTTRYAFLGFLPKTGKERERLIRETAALGLALVIYESPERVTTTLSDLFRWRGTCRVVVARELTKQFETFHRGVLGSPLMPELVERGEMVIVVEAGKTRENLLSSEERMAQANKLAAKLVRERIYKPKSIAKILVEQFAIKSQEAYDAVLRQK